MKNYFYNEENENFVKGYDIKDDKLIIHYLNEDIETIYSDHNINIYNEKMEQQVKRAINEYAPKLGAIKKLLISAAIVDAIVALSAILITYNVDASISLKIIIYIITVMYAAFKIHKNICGVVYGANIDEKTIEKYQYYLNNKEKLDYVLGTEHGNISINDIDKIDMDGLKYMIHVAEELNRLEEKEKTLLY